ncbi:TPA: hypothetical protein PCH12_002404 [Klebsiella pneumoniae]|nr:hypothetical protein CVG30_04730 [Klebsiella pneumoniae subsp. pneumoniae]EKB66089.1 hypothetical protein HMPREF1305_02841 [Klebsiella pneumoniae subsp. pneumoniae WGLW1]EKB77406.1 hypothetical protein HMPREF1307_03010 [Klebsiella pneumoniae subsp. pneumoniae WGLW3]EKJ7129076.1 hypothetical protein [Klebsiella pneumoniae]KKJ11644.1 hypothetical protein T642_22225 [Klebsiella pneumoniae HE12]KKJ36395.1 hypothetical protein T652_11460 [Klebsiella pneumoniae MRSN 3562]KKJ65469.1 hypothetical 
MMKYVVLLALSLFTSLSGWAFSLDNADIRLLCPQRGQIEVILHRYEHTQQSWGQHDFETGGGHVRQGPLLVIPFANLDQMIYHQTTGEFCLLVCRNGKAGALSAAESDDHLSGRHSLLS